MDHHALLSPIGQRPLLDGIRGLVKHETPSVISLLAGRPNPETFPFASLTLHLAPPLGSEPGTPGQDLEIKGDDVERALSYGPSAGWPNLNAGLVKFQAEVHNRPADDSWRLTVGAGCQDLISKAFHVLISPNDYVLVESPTYSGTLSMLSVIGDCKVVEVNVDSEGLDPAHLSKILDNWDETKKKPTIIYTVPVGSNPTGCSASKERKLEILKICSKHGILILEDDPYYFLTTNIVPSYFELETQVVPGGGQVVRFDSFSKILSSGLRLGFAVGPKKVLDAMDVYTACVNLQPSSMSQAIVWALMSNWGTKAFLEHCTKVAVLYEKRRIWFEELAHKHLDGIATWVSPTAGMFLFIDISPLTDARALALTTALAHGVLVVPGSSFYASAKTCSQLRLAFSIIEKDAADEALRRLGAAIKEARAEAGVL